VQGAWEFTLAVDNTFASASAAATAGTRRHSRRAFDYKYINGHSDVVGGALVQSDADLAERLKFSAERYRGCAESDGLLFGFTRHQDLPLRMRQHVAAASEIRWTIGTYARGSARALSWLAKPPAARALPKANGGRGRNCYG